MPNSLDKDHSRTDAGKLRISDLQRSCTKPKLCHNKPIGQSIVIVLASSLERPMLGSQNAPSIRSPHCLSAEWRDYHVDDYTSLLRKVCGSFGVDARLHERDKVRGAVETRLISRFETVTVSLDAHRVVRDRKMIRSDPGEHLFLIFQKEGKSTIIQEDRASELDTGDFFIADAAVPSEFVYGGRRSSQVSFHLPREEMIARLGKACVGGKEICRHDPLVPALTSVFTRLIEAEACSAALGEALINILCAYFHAQAHGSESASNHLYRRAVDRLEARARDASFGIDTLAADLGVSRRTLQRVFAEHGHGFTTRLQAIRLDCARSRLLGGETNILGVAYDSGFNDLSHFYRLFRDRFGVAPGQVKALSKPPAGRIVA
ncbi:helix-turn-helix domain-containing protein [Tabrizicola sp. TH137]|uniref:helix-turn-helix domain-containing protein n=1 Tax=Tabrizicola sp. TH137 TaxID=2067452 RepID=UPI00130461B2|nr:helix-turn-helix domain-containing protein [Tabrizicola sp. TH137]